MKKILVVLISIFIILFSISCDKMKDGIERNAHSNSDDSKQNNDNSNKGLDQNSKNGNSNVASEIEDTRQTQKNEDDEKNISEILRKNEIFKSKVQVGDNISISYNQTWTHSKVLNVSSDGIEVGVYEAQGKINFKKFDPPEVMNFKWKEIMHLNLEFR